MVEFGKRLEDECAQHGADWQIHCIDYGALKDLIGKGKKATSSIDAVAIVLDGHALPLANHCSAGDLFAPPPSHTHTPSHDHHLQFRYALDHEIETAVLFVLEEQGIIASELNQLARRRASFADRVRDFLQGGENSNYVQKHALNNELREIHEGYSMTARSLLQFVSFVDLNVTAVRKILKKHDKKSKHLKLSHSYLSAYTNEYVDSHLGQLYSEEGLSSLMVSLRRAFMELHQIELELLQMTGGNSRQNRRRSKSMSQVGVNNQPKHQRIKSTLPDSISSANNGGNVLVTANREPLLRMIQLSRDQLRHNTKYVDYVAAQALMFEGSDEDERSTSSEVTGSQRISSFLNLLSTFLYMTNYYIVAPTCGQYLESLGSTESMAGIAIGMTPNAALVATLLYGWWSNHSYKSALIFAALCSLLGNIAYAMALPYNSAALVMVGRALNGFGSARSINRRFICDTFSKRDRTAASAAFVTAGALGMACGPALAAILSELSPKLNSPGWVMTIPWSLYLIATIIFFEEPDRTHIFGEASKSTLELASNSSGEKSYLLADTHSSGELESNHKTSLISNVPVMTTLWIYFILKLVLECLMSSCPTMTLFYFGWSSRESGSFLAFLGLLMFPANMVVARLSHRFEDRELIRASLVAILCSIVGFAFYIPGAHHSVVQYMIFGVCIFIATNALEGPNMSLLSKSIPKSWAKGIFNTGFLATEAGTLARSVGDVWITLASHYAGVESILGAIFVPILVLCGASLVIVRRNYDHMVEDDDDDDDIKSKSSNPE